MSGVQLKEGFQTSQTMSGFLQTILKDLMGVFGAECGSLFLFDSQHNELILDSFHNAGNIYLKGLRKRAGEGVAGKVMALREPVLVEDIAQDRRFGRNGFTHYHTNSFISLPISTSQGMVGLINIADKKTGKPFSKQDLHFATMVIRYASSSLEHLMRCKRLEDEKDALHKHAASLQRYASVGKLASGIVHEINNPLDGVMRYSNILLNQVEENSVWGEYLLEIKKGLNRIISTTKSLLDFSHSVNGSSLREKSYVDVHKVIDDSLDALKTVMAARIIVTKKYDTALPHLLDIGLQHIINNNIKNAIDAMPEGGTLQIQTALQGSMIKISFRDTGYGIPKEILSHIFEPFFSTKPKEQGVGLGLSICKEIISKYEGKIEVESLPGKGTCFTVLIPAKFSKNA